MEEFPRANNLETERWKKIGGLDALKKVVASGVSSEHGESSDTMNASATTDGAVDREVSWQERYPDLYKEMIDNDVPMDPKEFGEKGYKFVEHENGSKHVAYPTPEYQEWLAKPEDQKGARPLRHHEELEERNRRKELERLTGAGKLFSKEAANLIYDELFPDGIKSLNKDIFLDYVLQGVDEVYPREDVLPKYVIGSCSETYADAFGKDNLEKPENLEKGVLRYTGSVIKRDYQYPGSWRFERPADKIAERLIDLGLQSDIPKVMLELSEENQKDIKEKAAIIALERGEFFPKTFAENPDSISQVFEKLGVDAHGDAIIDAALFGYGGYEKEPGAEARYFDLENKVAEMLDKGGRSGLSCPTGLSENEIDYEYNGHSEIALNNKITQKALDRIRGAESELVEALRSSSDLEKTIDEARKKKAEKEKKNLSEDIAKWNSINYRDDFDFEHYLDIKTIDVSRAESIEDFIHEKVSEKGGLGYYINEHAICERLDVPDVEMAIDYKNTIREGLLKRLKDGVMDVDVRSEWTTYYGHHTDSHNETAYLTDIFETQSFKDNQERIGIDFKNPDVFRKAFDGFLNTLKSRNGETSEQANWYYENIFANSPDEFLAMLKTFRESDECGRGMKAKITRFLNNNEDVFDYQRQNDFEKRLAEEEMGKHRALKVSTLRNATDEDIQKIVKDYEENLVLRMRKEGAKDIATFIGEKNINERQAETEEKDRKETPFDFGIEKWHALNRYKKLIEHSIPDSNVEWFTDTFPQKSNDTSIWERADSYFGICFEYEGKRCVIAESFNKEAAMYLWRGEMGEDFRELFDLSKFDAKRTRDPRIADVNHLDKEHFDESLDVAYQKAFLYFRTGDKDIVKYGFFDNGNPVRAKKDWKEYQELEYPAWPMGITSEKQNNPEDLTDYMAWHERQDKEERRLKEAMERGGAEEVRRESERIARENTNRLYNETMANV